MSKKQPKESQYVRVARLAYELTQAIYPLHTHKNSPKTFTQPQLAACVLLKFYLNLSYRNTEEWLLASDKVCGVLELAEVPDHSTISRMYKKMRMKDFERLNDRLLSQLEVEEEAISIDATGLSLTEASPYFLTRAGRKYHHYIKAFCGVGTTRQFILGWHFDWGPDSDMDHLNRMRRRVHGYGRQINGQAAWFLLADQGFDGEQARPYDIIKPRQGPTRRIRRPDRLLRNDLYEAARLEGLTGQRWKCETVYSVIKRLFGGHVRSRLALLQRREVAAKAVVYNIHRLFLPFIRLPFETRLVAFA
jgi:IS5 family transposase